LIICAQTLILLEIASNRSNVDYNNDFNYLLKY